MSRRHKNTFWDTPRIYVTLIVPQINPKETYIVNLVMHFRRQKKIAQISGYCWISLMWNFGTLLYLPTILDFRSVFLRTLWVFMTFWDTPFRGAYLKFQVWGSAAQRRLPGLVSVKTGRIDKMTKYTVYYFNIKGRGEIVRLMLTAAGVDFEDHRVQGEEWPKLKSSKFN